MSSTEIAIRAYTVIKGDRRGQQEKSTSFGPAAADMLGTERLLVFDTETTIDRFQNLKVGYFEVYSHRRLERRGMFFDTAMSTSKELSVLQKYCKEQDIELHNAQDFINKIFVPEVYSLQSQCIGFNLPFDLSRIAIDFGYARGSMSGGFSLKLTENPAVPRLQIKHLDDQKAFIQFANSLDMNKNKLMLKGNFVDCHVLVKALTGEKHSLRSACKLYGTIEQKADFEWKGKITIESLDYVVQDVKSTFDLFNKIREQYDLFGLDLPLSKVYSAASIGKNLLRMMGIRSAATKTSTIPDEIKGKCATAYLGGRTEDKIRKQETKVTVLDFTSMYPTMCILMRLWDFIICDHIEIQELTNEAKHMLDAITLDDLKNTATWLKMNVIVELEPDDDILPTRARYGDQHTWNIAVNHVTSDKKLWWALPDVINSKLQTGKVPKIARAIGFIPVGKQTGLQNVEILGKNFDPDTDNLFKWLIEYRQELQRQQRECKTSAKCELLEKKQHGIKIIANATSYGIYMQINTEDEPCDATVYGLSTFQCKNVPKTEQMAEFFNPVVAVLITSGARLVLGAVERILADNGAVHAYCDTDSMMVPPQFKERIQAFFQPLNPYSDGSVSMFKVDKYKDATGREQPLQDVYFFGLSSKRYVIYAKDALDEPIILKASSHGLKHLMNPFGSAEMGEDDDDYNTANDKDSKRASWHKEVWLDILNYHRGKITTHYLNEKYRHNFAVAKLAISTRSVMHRFRLMNDGQPYAKKVKPFNFCIVGIGNFVDPVINDTVKPLAPFSKDTQRCAYEDFVDYSSGRRLNGTHYWKKFSAIFWNYCNHPEAKFDGDTGELKRKHIYVSSVVHIGKESNNLDISDVIGVQTDDSIIYSPDDEMWTMSKDIILSTPPRQVKHFITERTWQRIQKTLRSGHTPRSKGKVRIALKKWLRQKDSKS